MSEKYSSIWESQLNIVGDESEVDGNYILAKVSGPSFFPDRTSRNRVHYPRLAWENAINDPVFQSRLKNRQVLGTIGHDLELDDSKVREGLFSHIVSRVWIDESGVGNAEYLILNTPPGRVLNTILRAKSKIYVSTKANGEFDKVENDIKHVNPDVFFLERIDFVIDPGFLETNPQLLESYRNLTREDNKTMSNIDEAKFTELQESLDKYQQLGSPEKLSRCIDLLEQYVKLGSVEKISEALKKSKERISQLTEIVQKGFTDVNEALTMDNMSNELKEYQKLGTIDEIKQLIKISCEQHKTLMESRAKEVAQKYNISESFVRKQYNKGMKMADIEEMLKAFKEEMDPEDDEEVLEDPVGDEVDSEEPMEDPEVVEPEAEGEEPMEVEEEPEAEDDEDEENVEEEMEGEEPAVEAEAEPEVEDDMEFDLTLDEEPIAEKKRCAVRESKTMKASDVRRVKARRKIVESKKTPSFTSRSLVSKLMK